MSETQTPIVAVTPTTDSLKNPAFIIAIVLLTIAAGTIAAVFWKGDAAVQNVVAGTVIGGIIGSITGFYYGSSKGSQAKDETATIKSVVSEPGQ